MWHFSQSTLCVVSSLVALVMAVRARRSAKRGRRYLAGVYLLASCVAAFLGAVVFRPGLLSFQKWLVTLAMPVGLAWLFLLVMTWWYHTRTRRFSAAVAAMLALMLTLAGNNWVSRSLIARLEQEYRDLDPLEVARVEPLDVVVALGGATSRTPAGQIQVTDAGDRLLLTARIYHAGLARQLICTGEKNRELLGTKRHPAEEYAQLWRELGVPAEAILTLPGRNTKEEFEAIARQSRGNGWKRIGVVTSAYHMQRAKRLAAAVGIEIVPLPAHFMGRVPTVDRINIVPNAQFLAETSLALKEMLARLVGR